MKKIMWGVVMLLALLPVTGFAYQRDIPPKAKVKKIEVNFNGETINGYYMMIDSRTVEEKEADKTAGALKGNAIAFFQGHGQRPGDCYEFSELLAAQSRSGIIMVPVCDTPYGKDPQWRGDRGKMAVLMAMIRYMLNECGVTLEGYRPITDMEIKINDKPIEPAEGNIKTRLCVVGWSHGGILAREFTHCYPDAVTGMAAVCPAGYKKWGGVCHLMGRFSLEGMHIATLTFTSQAGDALGAGWGLTRGVVGDSARSVTDSISSAQYSKLGRSYRDIKDCTRYLDDTNAAVPGVKDIVVIFGRSDTCMNAKDYGIKDLDNPSAEDVAAFWKTYYPSNAAADTRLTFKILPGMHTGPATDGDIYAEAVLSGLEELDAENAAVFPREKKKDGK